jgi:hypothetical protein
MLWNVFWSHHNNNNMKTKIITLLILAAGLFVACSGDLDGIVDSGSAVLTGANDTETLSISLHPTSILNPLSLAPGSITIQRNWTSDEHLEWTATIASGSITSSGSFASGNDLCTIQYVAGENSTQSFRGPSTLFAPITITAVDGSWTFSCELLVRYVPLSPPEGGGEDEDYTQF